MNEVMIGIIGLAVVLLMFLTGIELGFAMALVGFLGFSYIVSFKAGLNLIAKDMIWVRQETIHGNRRHRGNSWDPHPT